MSVRYGIDPVDLSGMKSISLGERGGKVKVCNFASVYSRGSGMAAFLESLPHILAADTMRDVASAMFNARANGKPIIWAMGGHVIKCGLAPVLIDLMRRGYATAFAMNGSASIHDFEIAIAGHTSEDVEASLPDGRFGTAAETGREWNAAMAAATVGNIGAGESLGHALDRRHEPEDHASASLLLQAWLARVPVTVHIAVGTDTPHTHPAVDPAALGSATHRDFRLFCRLVAALDGGGVYINAGSAVVMPEVFLKAVSCVRNLGHQLHDFTTVNLDFQQHYRPRVNVVERPHAQTGGKPGGNGYALTGHHEIMIPLLAAALIEKAP
jgi:hypothetical protein